MKFKKMLLKFNSLFSFFIVISALSIITSSITLYVGTNYVGINYDYTNNEKIIKFGYGTTNWGYEWDENGNFIEDVSKQNRKQYNNSYDLFLKDYLNAYNFLKEENKKNPSEKYKKLLDAYYGIIISRNLIITSSSILSIFILLFFINLILLVIVKNINLINC